MKRSLIICVLILLYQVSAAQQTTIKTARIYSSYTEKYSVLTDSPAIRHGLYQALYNKKTAVASGQYIYGKRSGTWHFFDTKGTLLQNYNYDTNKLTYLSPADTLRGIQYVVDGSIDTASVTTRPVKFGGVYFGFLPYLKQFVLPPDLSQAELSIFSAVVELLVSPGGRLADYKIRVVSPGFEYNKVAKMDMDYLAEEDKLFLPATINTQPVAVTIYIPCRILNNGQLQIK